MTIPRWIVLVVLVVAASVDAASAVTNGLRHHWLTMTMMIVFTTICVIAFILNWRAYVHASDS